MCIDIYVDIYIEQIELQAKLLNYFLGSNKSNINQKYSFIYVYISLYLCIHVCVFVCVCHISIYVYILSGILPPRIWPCGRGGRAQEQGVGVSEISCHGSMYIRSMTLSVSRTVSFSLSQAFVHPRTHPLTNHSPTPSFYF